MGVKPNTPGDSGDGGGGESVPSVSGGAGYGLGPINMDTDALNRLGGLFDGIYETVRTYYNSTSNVITYEPVIDGQSDETWEQVKPNLFAGNELFFAGLAGLGKIMDFYGQSFYNHARAGIRAEDTAEQIAARLAPQGGVPEVAGDSGDQVGPYVRAAQRDDDPGSQVPRDYERQQSGEPKTEPATRPVYATTENRYTEPDGEENSPAQADG
jgi:hypothetical protein